ncbi:hypothetical protein [Streptomyces sp. NPDC006012]|uniref:hypothetical protein n=1 Tax=Streptomyces sp. NPDC006012 TaxID=3364739 RepID=UPI0036C461A1
MAENGVDGPGARRAFGRRPLLAVDAKGYGGVDTVTQRHFQEAIVRLLDEAAAAARLDRDRWLTQEGGDSLFAVLPEGVYEPDLVDTFMRNLDAGLRAFNRHRERSARLRLRAAVHFGPAAPGANGFVGAAPVEAGRILDCAALRRALDEAPDACLAVGLSAVVFRDVVKAAHTTVREDEFRCAAVAEKEYRGEAWIWVPGAGVRRPEPTTQEPATPEAVTSEAVTPGPVPGAAEPTAPAATGPGDSTPAESTPSDSIPAESPPAETPSRGRPGGDVYTLHVASGGAGAQGPGANATVNNTYGGGR